MLNRIEKECTVCGSMTPLFLETFRFGQGIRTLWLCREHMERLNTTIDRRILQMRHADDLRQVRQELREDTLRGGSSGGAWKQQESDQLRPVRSMLLDREARYRKLIKMPGEEMNRNPARLKFPPFGRL